MEYWCIDQACQSCAHTKACWLRCHWPEQGSFLSRLPFGRRFYFTAANTEAEMLTAYLSIDDKIILPSLLALDQIRSWLRSE